jgi:hypothetical protein
LRCRSFCHLRLGGTLDSFGHQLCSCQLLEILGFMLGKMAVSAGKLSVFTTLELQPLIDFSSETPTDQTFIPCCRRLPPIFTSTAVEAPTGAIARSTPLTATTLAPLFKQALKDYFLFHKIWKDIADIVDDACAAPNALITEIGRIKSVAAFTTFPLET